MKKLSYLELSIQALEALNRPATYRDVWEYIKQNQLYKQLKSYDDTIGIASIGKTPSDSIGAFLYTEAKNPMVKFTQKAADQNISSCPRIVIKILRFQ